MALVPLEPGNRIQLPADWAEALGPNGLVTLEQTAEGILIRPCPRATWDEISARRLIIGSSPPEEDKDHLEARGDDFLF